MRYANERTRAAAEGDRPDSGAATDDSIAANMVRAAGRTVSPQPATERDLSARQGEAEAR